MHILFYKLTSNSSNKKLVFLPVQSGPGGLQGLTLGANFQFFSDMLLTSKKMHILFYRLTSNSSNKKILTFTSPELTWWPAGPEL